MSPEAEAWYASNLEKPGIQQAVAEICFMHEQIWHRGMSCPCCAGRVISYFTQRPEDQSLVQPLMSFLCTRSDLHTLEEIHEAVEAFLANKEPDDAPDH